MRSGGGDWEMELKGRIIYKGLAQGEALVTTQPISFYGGVDPATGVVIEKGHQLQGAAYRSRKQMVQAGPASRHPLP